MKNTILAITTLTGSLIYIGSAVGQERAPTLESIGPAGYQYCVANATNNNQSAVGICSAEKGNSLQVAWLRHKTGEIFVLPPLASNKSCRALRISEQGKIYGLCLDASEVNINVVWDGSRPSSAPIALKPAGQDKSVAVTTMGSSSLVGQSFTEANQKGQSMPVVWRFDSGVAEPVTGSRDSCVPTSMMESTTGYTWISLNCPGSPNNSTAKVATKKPNSPTYVVTALQLPDKSTQCTLGNTNDPGQTIAVCHFPNGVLRTTYWQTIDSPPTSLDKPPYPQNAPTKLNSSGNALIVYTDTRVYFDALWNIYQNKVSTITPLPKTDTLSTIGPANNNIVLLNTRDAQNVDQGAFLSRSLETVGIGFFKGGKASYVKEINQDGNYAVGSATGADGKEYAIGFALSDSALKPPILESGAVVIPPAVAP
ncbi:hypothetical protein [Pseudomonas sp. NPDC086278]|uniref:hypothetical protein n=1 Tax=Pseudomonas sp. NPDC086278 TaxID=3390646 RepID=UPI003CFDC3E3